MVALFAVELIFGVSPSSELSPSVLTLVPHGVCK
jgi:hypothetical protein